MTTVTITRRQNRYRRSINGAWVGSHVEVEVLERDEDWLRTKDVQHPNGVVRQRVSLGDGMTVVWPDGVTESAYPGNHGVGNYPPACIPHNGRLSKLLAG